jgi:hypothetical protein
MMKKGRSITTASSENNENLCKYAATKGMNVEIEVFDYDVDKRSLIGPAPLAARFAAEIRELP